MASIYKLSIRNFRGIKAFDQFFHEKKFICLIGRGDSGKSTILEAISYALSSNWNITFYDSDFYNCNTSEPIVIEVTLTDLPEFFLHERFGLFLRGIGIAKDDLFDDLELGDSEPAMTIRLEINEDLEPVWTISNERNGSAVISASSRAKLNTFLISDYSDRHFSWNKGNPLYSLYKLDDKEKEDKKNVIINALRQAKEKIDKEEFSDLQNVIDKIENKALEFGLNIPETSTSIDFKDIFIKDNKVSLHDESKVPFRQKGKGSKRLLSMAIQTLLAENGGIILIDEIEQGLEPDRVQHIVSTLKRNKNIQTFITTHSGNVIVELNASDLYLLNKENGFLQNVNSSLQGNIRRNPEALFAKRIVVCEGATEVGVCRAVNDFLIDKNGINAAHKGIRFVDGNGANFVNDCLAFKKLNFDVVAFCDSDDETINKKKDGLIEKGIEVVDCVNEYSIENQIFQDLPWDGIIKLVNYKEEKTSSQSVKDQVEHYLGTQLLNDWMQQESKELRKANGISAKNGEWFKRIDHGQFLGFIICQNLRLMEGKKLKYQIEKLISWIHR